MSAKEHYRREIEAAISKAKASGFRETVTASDGAEAYAYPQPGEGIAWGVNAAKTGWSVRGIRRRRSGGLTMGEVCL